MPTLHGSLRYTGTIDELVAYQMKNSDKTIVRKKAYIPKDAYKNEGRYASMRRNSSEFTGCAYAGKMVRMALWPVMQLADHNMAPVVNSFCKAIQKRDTTSNHGERSVLFSAYKESFTALAFTKQHLFDSVCKQRPTAELSRTKGSLHIHWGELVPGFNFQLPWNKPYFRIIGCIGAIADVHFSGSAYHQKSGVMPNACVFGDWMTSGKKMPAQSMIIQLTEMTGLEESAITLLGAIGIQMGQADIMGEIHPVKYASTARILTAC
jgi:hypothetical protein